MKNKPARIAALFAVCIFSALILCGCCVFHSYEKEVTPPACEEDGFTTLICSKCGKTRIKDTVTAAGHTEVYIEAIPATCTEKGKSDGIVCAVCGIDIVPRTELHANGHRIATSQEIKPTCSTFGRSKGTYCTVCGEVLSGQNVIRKIPHAQADENGYCTVCGEPRTADILAKYIVPEDLGAPEYSEAEIQKMIDDGLTLDEVAEKIRTVADLLQYLSLKKYTYILQNMHFTYAGKSYDADPSARVSFEHNYGDCGGIANLVNYILRGDYESQGYVDLRRDTPLGHVFNYFYQNGKYHYCDFSEMIRDRVCEIVSRDSEYYDYSDGSNIVVLIQYKLDGNYFPYAYGASEKHPYLPEDHKDDIKILRLASGYWVWFAPFPPESAWPEDAV